MVSSTLDRLESWTSSRILMLTLAMFVSLASVLLIFGQQAYANNCYTYTRDCTNPSDTRWNCASSAYPVVTQYNAWNGLNADLILRKSSSCDTAWVKLDNIICYTSANYDCDSENGWISRYLSNGTVYTRYGLEYGGSVERWGKQMQNPYCSVVDGNLVDAGYQHNFLATQCYT